MTRERSQQTGDRKYKRNNEPRRRKTIHKQDWNTSSYLERRDVAPRLERRHNTSRRAPGNWRNTDGTRQKPPTGHRTVFRKRTTGANIETQMKNSSTGGHKVVYRGKEQRTSAAKRWFYHRPSPRTDSLRVKLGTNRRGAFEALELRSLCSLSFLYIFFPVQLHETLTNHRKHDTTTRSLSTLERKGNTHDGKHRARA